MFGHQSAYLIVRPKQVINTSPVVIN